MVELINEIKVYARENRIPIMFDDGIEYLCDYIKKNRVKRILEIGSGIGYSAIKMALVASDIHVTTIERDSSRYTMAVLNVRKLNLKQRIKVINNDALLTDVDGKFDLIFIDAAKSKNLDFFTKFSPKLAKYGTIVTDNLSFHGLVENDELIKTDNQRLLVSKIRKYKEFLDNNNDFITVYAKVGDCLALTRRKDDELDSGAKF
ncbi:MAG: O-methyltransferase [bacterium]|nr:O-methyltransferase [bacterium]